MRIVRQYDLTTAVGMDKSSQEIILQRTPARMDTDFDAMNLEDAREVRKVDTKHCVDFWSALPAAHGGVHSRFNHLYGSMSFGFVHLAAADLKWREVPEQVGRASHKRAVLAPVVVSAMYRTKLLGDTTMEQSTVCTHSPVSHPHSAGMFHHLLHIVLVVHGRATAIAKPHVTRGVAVLGGVETNTVMCIHSGV